MSTNLEFRDKLAKVLSRLSSPYDAEALAAARLASSMLNDAHLTWQSLLVTATDDEISDQEMVERCARADRNSALFDPGESTFLRLVRSEIRRRCVLTAPQRSTLRTLYRRAAGGAR